MPRKRRGNASARSQLHHAVCSRFSQSGTINTDQLSFPLDRPARLLSLKVEMASPVGATVQLRTFSADSSEIWTSPIMVVGPSTVRRTFRMPSSDFGAYTSKANVIQVSFAAGANSALIFSADLTVLYGYNVKSLC